MDGNDKYVGKVLDNRYEILELIGTGGMALVYRARCHRLNRMVAIKILKEDLAGDDEFRRRFHTESQAVAMLSHPNIVAVYDVSRSDNVEYIVMELIEGITLKQYINKKGLLSWKEALHFATQVIKALSHAHSRGIIHRDIKPHNIMILKDGSVKVADFGIARLLSVQNTLTQEALGSVHYISPEQAKGGHVDARSDIYSLGVVMYEMLTSHLPFVGESAVSVAIQHISAIPLFPRDINPDIPVGLEDITMHAMEPDINMRFTTADEMQRDLEEFRKNPSIVFNYDTSGPYDRQQPEVSDMDDTRVVPKSANGKTENADTRANGAIAKVERPLPPRKKAIHKAELSSDEYRVVKTRASSTSTLVGVFSIMVFIVLVIIFMWNFLLKDIFSREPEEQITIPNFVNRRYDDLIKSDEYRELYEFTVERYEYSDDYPQGYVITQNPVADRPRSMPLPGKKISVTLIVSDGAEPPFTMPNLIGMHFSNARIELERLSLGLKIEFDEPVYSQVEKSLVLETIPAANEPLPRGTTVLIVYSAGPERRREIVPNLLGETREAVEDVFATLGLIPEFIYRQNDEPEGTVLTIARMDQEVDIPTTIIVYISTGPVVIVDPSPDASTDPSPDISPDTSPDASPSTSPDTSATPSPDLSIYPSPDISPEQPPDASPDQTPDLPTIPPPETQPPPDSGDVEEP